TGYQGSSYSGLFIYSPGANVQVGDRINIVDGLASSYFGQIQMANPTFALGPDGGVLPASSGNPTPAPVPVMPFEVSTDGGRGPGLESVLVSLPMVSVTDLAPPLNGG